MKSTAMVACTVLLLGLSACGQGPQPPTGGGTPRAGTPPITNAAGSSQGSPQPPNSLPPGARVNSPIASPTGALETTRVR